MQIDNTYNYDGAYFRMVGISLAKTFSKGIRWINRFEDKKIRVLVPFYLSLAGDERFVLDAFTDDVVAKRVELNTDQIPRGVISLKSINTSGDEFANPNQFLSKEVKINNKLRKIFSKTKAIPVEINYDISIVVDTELDVYRVYEKILKVLFNYMFFSIDYFGMKIDFVLNLPDDKEIVLARNDGMDNADTKKFVNFSVTVKGYYPDFFIDTDDYEVCSNDAEINWENLGMLPPSETADIPNIKRVYWKNYIFGDGNIPDPDDVMRSNTPPESF